MDVNELADDMRADLSERGYLLKPSQLCGSLGHVAYKEGAEIALLKRRGGLMLEVRLRGVRRNTPGFVQVLTGGSAHPYIRSKELDGLLVTNENYEPALRSAEAFAAIGRRYVNH